MRRKDSPKTTASPTLSGGEDIIKVLFRHRVNMVRVWILSSKRQHKSSLVSNVFSGISPWIMRGYNQWVHSWDQFSQLSSVLWCFLLSDKRAFSLWKNLYHLSSNTLTEQLEEKIIKGTPKSTDSGSPEKSDHGHKSTESGQDFGVLAKG